jgi:hypothetical protein
MLNAAIIQKKTNQFNNDLIGPPGMRERPLLNSFTTSSGDGVDRSSIEDEELSAEIRMHGPEAAGEHAGEG